MTEQKPLEPWQWPEAHWRKLVNQVRAGRACARRAGRTARAAPSRSRSTAITRPTSCARAANPSAAWPGASTATASACRASSRCSKKYDVPATFYVPAVAALIHPDEQRQVIAEGHEIGIHSWIHELNSVLSYEAESDIMHARRRHAGEDHRRAAGRLRAPPHGISPRTRCASPRRWGSSTIPR